MLGLLLTVLVSAAPAFPSASVTCPDGPASCDGATVLLVDAGAAEAPRGYATPAVIDCRVTLVPPVLQTLVGECDGTPRDASYRASRDPESERSGGSMVPARDRRRNVTACHGLPREGADLTVSQLQPMALFALPRLLLASTAAPLPRAALRFRWRTREPLERPPRA